jgi:hypothetical protein
MLSNTLASRLLLDHVTSTNLAMTTSEVPQWLQTVNEKRLARENAIRKFLDVHKTRFEVGTCCPWWNHKWTVDGELDTATRRFWKRKKHFSKRYSHRWR